MGCRLAAIAAALVVLFGSGCGDAFAGTASDSAIVVTGNHRIGAEVVRSHLHADKDGNFSASALDAGLKELYATGLFSDVKISRDGGRVVVAVAENPTIFRVAFEGNKKIKDDDLKKLDLQSKANGPFWRAYVQSDVEHVLELYRSRGYFNVRITPQTISQKNGRVDLVFAVNEGDKLAVRKIAYAGNTAFSANKLEGVVKSGETNLLSFLLNNDNYDSDRIESDRDLLRQFYLAHGYADVQILSSSSYDAVQKGVVLTFTIKEGPQYRIGAVDVTSALKAVDAGSLRSSLRMQTGDVYNVDAANKTTEDLAMQLARNGQPFAAIAVRDERVAAAHLINLTYAVEQGRRLYI